MNAQLNTAPSIVTEIAEYSQTAAALSDLRHRYLGVAFNVTTTKGMDEAKKARQEVKCYRTALEAKRKEIKAPALERCRLIDDEAKTITMALLELEEPIDGQIKAEEARKEAEKAAKAEAERLRIARHQAVILYLRGIPADVASESADKVLAALNELDALDITSSLEEFQGQAQQTKDESLAKLREMHAAAVAHEAEQARIKAEQEAEAARIAAERAELARLRAEAEAREREAAAARAEQERKDSEARQAVEAEQAAKLAAERAAQAEELRKQREAQEAEMRAQREAQAKADAEAAAARRAEEARLAAERAELRRLQDEADAKRRADEEAKHAADIKARNAAPMMLAALQQIAELSTEAKVKKIAAAAIKEAL
jgi:colicin import membrane protein